MSRSGMGSAASFHRIGRNDAREAATLAQDMGFGRIVLADDIHQVGSEVGKILLGVFDPHLLTADHEGEGVGGLGGFPRPALGPTLDNTAIIAHRQTECFHSLPRDQPRQGDGLGRIGRAVFVPDDQPAASEQRFVARPGRQLLDNDGRGGALA